MSWQNLKRRWRYREGQRRAIDALGFAELPKHWAILDVGCGIGTGMLYFKKLGFRYVLGFDNDPCRMELTHRRNLTTFNDDMDNVNLHFLMPFHIIWSSHSFEHSKKPDKVLEILKNHTDDDALFFFILPYPDSNPAELHTASRQIGLDIDDDGKTVVKWFEDRGLELLYQKRDSWREPEIWLKFKK
jgi:SAM-dependent methyltransferase